MDDLYDDLTKRIRFSTRGLSLLTNDIRLVLDEEREALSRVNALVAEWSIEDRRRR